jgi:hypothetical protein
VGNDSTMERSLSHHTPAGVVLHGSSMASSSKKRIWHKDGGDAPAASVGRANGATEGRKELMEQHRRHRWGRPKFGGAPAGFG